MNWQSVIQTGRLWDDIWADYDNDDDDDEDDDDDVKTMMTMMMEIGPCTFKITGVRMDPRMTPIDVKKYSIEKHQVKNKTTLLLLSCCLSFRS